MAGWIKKGMIVVSMTNIDIPLTVEDFIYKSGEFVDKEGNKYRKKCLIGVQCYRFDENKIRIHERFHSKELVPHEVALKGIMEAYSFHARDDKYKSYWE